MQTFNRSGVQIEQCGSCRGIFLDYGELEALTRMEAQWAQAAPPPPPPNPHSAPPPPPPAWGAPQPPGYHHGHHGHYGKGHRGFGRMLFSS